MFYKEAKEFGNEDMMKPVHLERQIDALRKGTCKERPLHLIMLNSNTRRLPIRFLEGRQEAVFSTGKLTAVDSSDKAKRSIKWNSRARFYRQTELLNVGASR